MEKIISLVKSLKTTFLSSYKQYQKEWVLGFTIAIAVLLVAFLVWRLYADEAETDIQTFGSDSLDEELSKKLLQKQKEKYLSGKTESYEWLQFDDEFEVRVPISETLKTKDIQMDVKPLSIQLKVGGNICFKGQFYSEVAPPDCIWQFETDEKLKQRFVEITIRKKIPTKEASLWQYFIKEDAKPTSDMITDVS